MTARIRIVIDVMLLMAHYGDAPGLHLSQYFSFFITPRIIIGPSFRYNNL